MKRKLNYTIALSLLLSGFIAQNTKRINEIAENVTLNSAGEPEFITLRSATPVYEINTESFINSVILENKGHVKKLKSETDELGFTHTKFNLLVNNIPVNNAIINVHAKGGKIVSLNGDLHKAPAIANAVSINEPTALKKALDKVNAKAYKWEDKAEEALLKKALNDPQFSYFPKGNLVLVPSTGKNQKPSLRYAYKFDVFASEPLYHANVYIDAQNGTVLSEENLIHHVDVPATATTKFSGVQTMTVDNYAAGLYRLQETSRGLGVETYDLNTSMTYSAAVDYTNTSTSWTTTTIDQVGTDAHWGAERVYDYYLNEHNRNSIDNAGHKLISFVDYGVGYSNAFWSGAFMTYGSGGGGGFTGLDICGHEITHGLTSKTANLVYQNESGALNESYSDIFGTCVEFFGKPAAFNWLMGEDVGVIRSMSNPNAYGDPDTYNGVNWFTGTADNGGVHTNSGVSNYWFYLLCQGGTGVNDISSSYTVSALGMTKAAKIAFRALTVYYTANTNYAAARNLSIQAAIDLYGPCSNEVYQTKSAWYAVGVGPTPSGTVTPIANFTSVGSSACSLPYNVNFMNGTYGGDNYVWDFGDGSAVSTATNPSHSYTLNGTYNVKLKAFSTCAASPDSIVKNAYIVINALSSPTVSNSTAVCDSGNIVLNAGGSDQQYWYSTPTATGTPLYIGNTFTTPTVYANTTYYVVNTFTNAPIYGGPISNTIGAGASFPGNTAYDSLTVIQPCTLRSVVVQASSAGSRIFQLRNSMNTVINSTTVTLAAGVNTVTLNFKLTPGIGYRLGLGPSTAFLYRNTAGVTFPYNIGSLISITGSSQGPNYYFFFYNWEVVADNCTSTPVAVTASVNTAVAANVTPSQTLACTTDGLISLSATPSGGTFSGASVSGSNFDPSIGAATYTVNYSYTDGNNCTGYGATNIVVSPCIGINELNANAAGVVVYPNPFNDVILVKGLLASVEHTIRVTNAIGKVVYERAITNDSETIDLEKLAQGVYFIEVTNTSGILYRSKLVKQ